MGEPPTPCAFMNVWEPYVEAYHQMGWMIYEVIYENRGGNASYLMVYPCQCRLPYLKSRGTK